jgi:hypothetical protein
MKRTKLFINLIASWQLLLALALLFGEIIRIQNMSWGPPPDLPDNIIRWTQGPGPITWLWLDTYFVVFILISFAACISLFLRKKWASVLSDMSSGLTIAILIVWYIDALSLISEFGSLDFFVDYVIPAIIALILMAPSVFNIIYLTRPHVKAYFKKPQIEPAIPING